MSAYLCSHPSFPSHILPSTSSQVPPPPALVIVISGPSGVGKDAVIRRLQEKRPDLYFVVTATSRPMRPGERDGVDYFFVTREEFESWIDNGRLLEHAVVYGEYKGIPRQQVEDALDRGTDVVLRIDVQGAATMRRLLPGLVSVFIVADNEAELVQRLVSRKTEPMVRKGQLYALSPMSTSILLMMMHHPVRSLNGSRHSMGLAFFLHKSAG